MYMYSMSQQLQYVVYTGWGWEEGGVGIRASSTVRIIGYTVTL